MNTPGCLIVIEGIDGAGKSTLLRRLAEWIRSKGRNVVTSREPTDGPHGAALRASARSGRLSAEAELDLFLKDRAEHVATLIAPALARGDVVLLDRYYFSTAAYQGARGLDAGEIIKRNEAFAPVPDLVLLLDLDPRACSDRIHARGAGHDHFEAIEYLAKVREIFLFVQRPFIARIDASRAAEEVFADCAARAAAVLGLPDAVAAS